MDTYMSADVLDGLDRARKLALQDSKRLRISVEGAVFPVLRSWDGGFSLAAKDAPHLRGTVEFCDGTRVLYECLIVCSALDGPERIYEYKRRTDVSGEQPLDYVRAEDAPVALIGR